MSVKVGLKKQKYGSFEVHETKQEGGTFVVLYGLSADIAELPTNEDIMMGSTAYCVDTGAVYMYDNVNKTWVAQ